MIIFKIWAVVRQKCTFQERRLLWELYHKGLTRADICKNLGVTFYELTRIENRAMTKLQPSMPKPLELSAEYLRRQEMIRKAASWS